jgi:hypothetical protein
VSASCQTPPSPMDAYLELARTVLRSAKRPMTAAAILETAYKARIVPAHLHGKTQQKTLQARLSVEILTHRDRSPFFRTEPGFFFLNELVTDPSVPTHYKERFQARRRTRDLHTLPFLAFEKSFFETCDVHIRRNWLALVKGAEDSNAIHYIHSKDDAVKSLVVWTFSIVRRGTRVLSYRTGRYRDDSETFANKRTIGFPGVVNFFD